MQELSPDEKAQKAKLTEPIAEGETYTNIVVKRDKTKSGYTRYYMYENNNLLIAAECHIHNNNYKYYISLESKAFAKNSPQIIGICSIQHFDRDYQCFKVENGNETLCMKIKYVPRYQRKGPNRIMELIFPKEMQNTPEVGQSSDFMTDYKAKFPENAEKVQKKSSKNFFLKIGDRHCFSFAKLFDDEYHFAISNPFSILDGFLIALSTFHMTNEE